MRAALLSAYETPLELVDMPAPIAAPGEAVVRVRACGICGSDRFLQKGGFNSVLPIVPGHESAGEIVELPDGRATHAGLRVGDRVAIYYLAHCGHCRFCKTGRENICRSVERIGVDRHGALAEYVQVPVENLLPIPVGMGFAEAAVVTDSLGTPLHALRIAGTEAGDTVLVLGVGGIGSNAIQIAKLIGATVIAASRSDEALEVARTLGADHVVRADDALADAVRDLTDGLGVEAVLQCAPSESAYQLGFKTLMKGGKLVVVGTTHSPVPFPTNDILWGELEIRGSRGFTRADVRQALEWVSQGRLRVDHLTRVQLPLARVNEALSNLDRADVVRTVVIP